jgi:hypothetical protein
MDAQEPQTLELIEEPQIQEAPQEKVTVTIKPQETEQQLTMKQRKWLKIYIETGNKTEAAMQAYDCKDRNTAAQIGWENLKKLDFIDFLDEAGLSDKLLIDKVKTGLDSKKYLVHKGKIVAVPDPTATHKYVETGLKLRRRLIERQEIEETKTVNINVDTLLMKVYGGNTTEPTSTT